MRVGPSINIIKKVHNIQKATQATKEFWPTLPLIQASRETKGQATLKAPSRTNDEIKTVYTHYRATQNYWIWGPPCQRTTKQCQETTQNLRRKKNPEDRAISLHRSNGQEAILGFQQAKPWSIQTDPKRKMSQLSNPFWVRIER